MVLGWAACGVIFGDIGTSPLYVFSSTFTERAPTENDVLGAMSIIFWSITLLVVVSSAACCFLSLQADRVPTSCARGHSCTLQSVVVDRHMGSPGFGLCLGAYWQRCTLSTVQRNILHIQPLHG